MPRQPPLLLFFWRGGGAEKQWSGCMLNIQQQSKLFDSSFSHKMKPHRLKLDSIITGTLVTVEIDRQQVKLHKEHQN